MLFEKKTRRHVPANGLNLTVQRLRESLSNGGMATTATTRAALSMESISEAEIVGLDSAMENLTQALESIASDLGVAGKLTGAQMDAAKVAGIVAGDVSAFLRHPVTHQMVANESMSVVTNTGIADGFSKRAFGMEAYDEKDNRNAAVYSIAYNMQSARQDEFGETFFPTVVITPDTIGFSVSVRLVQVYDDLHRNVTGALDNFNKRNIIQALIDPSILKNDQTRIVPVARAQAAANFVDPAVIPVSNYMLEGESIATAPLAIGKRFSLLGISQTDTLLANGVMDFTDSIDPAVTLQSLYVSAGTDVLKFSTQNLPLANFAPAPQALHRLMNLNFRTTSLLLTHATTNLDGTPLATLAPVVAGNLIVRLGVSVTGSVNLELADTEVFANGLHVESVQDSAGNMLDLSVAPAKAIVDAIAAATVIGYDLTAYRTNMNRRQRGQLLDTSYYTQMYAVALRGPITVPRPVTTDGSTDSSDLAALITATHIRTSNAAVTTLLQAANVLDEYVDARDTAGVGPDVLGVGRFLVRPTFFREDMDMLTAIDSIASHKRAADIQAVLVSKVRDMAYRLYRDSGYKAAADAMAGGTAKAPTVIIGTDPMISRYLMVDGDLRTLGSDFDVRVVSTLDKRMAGKIAIAFGDFSGESNGPNPLHFGNMAWKPELTVVMPISRGGQVSKELTVQPSFLHVVNTPILAFVTVSNIPEVTASKVKIFTHNV